LSQSYSNFQIRGAAINTSRGAAINTNRGAAINTTPFPGTGLVTQYNVIGIR